MDHKQINGQLFEKKSHELFLNLLTHLVQIV